MALYYPSTKPYTFFDEFDKVMDNALVRFFNGGNSSKLLENYHKTNTNVDVIEYNDHFEVLADVPGFDDSDIKVEHVDNYLVIHAEKRKEHEDKSSKYYTRERTLSKFYRSFTLPEHVDQENIDATLNNGVLKINIPKLENNVEKKKRLIPLKKN